MQTTPDPSGCDPSGTRQVATGLAKAGLAALTLGLLLSMALLSAPNGALAQDEPAVRYRDIVFDGVDTTNGVVYGTAIDKPSGQEVELQLDIYEPRGDTETKRAAFIFIHGGGFTGGNRGIGRTYCSLMAQRGYFAVSISYRLNQGNVATDGIPAAVSDARQAVRWVHDHAADHRIDTDRVTIGGSSAGAITSLFVAYTDTEKDPGLSDSGVAAVMDLWGGLYIAVDEMEAGEPPLAIIHGTEDSVVPFSEAEKLRQRAESVGIPYAWHPIEGAGHAPWEPATFMTWTAEFFYDQLWSTAAETPTATATATESSPPTPMMTATATEPASTATPTDAPSVTPDATDDPDADGAELFIPWSER